MIKEKSGLLLSTAYFPPVAWFALIAASDIAWVEMHENYNKQSYRNRCCIMSANGILPLIIPVKRNRGCKTPVTEIKPDYSYPWQRLHRISIESAYRSAPFYEYYIDGIRPFLEKKHDRLIEINTAIAEHMINILGIDMKLLETNSYEKPPRGGIADMRNSLHPKTSIPSLEGLIGFRRYRQVFSDRHGFIQNLSIIDLIFNLGPEAAGYIRELSVQIREQLPALK